MVFPYVGGASFVQKLWAAKASQGFVAPLGSLLPQSTEQVLHAGERFLTTRDAPTEIRFANKANALYENTMGELETGILLTAHLGADATRAATGWDGDRYQLVKSGDRKILLWQSVWDDAPAADRFAAAYKQVARMRPDRGIRVARNTIQNRAGVLIIDAEHGIDVNKIAAPAVRILP
jgi:hypothetical protein